MATAEELLSSTTCDDILTVDLESRKIIIPNTVQNLGVESDDNVRILHFRVPRYYCTVDLSEFAIRINYKNAKGSGDLYDVTTFVVEDDVIAFDWIVGRYAVTYEGNVIFNVCLREVADGVVNREFNTTIATLPVLRGLETGEAIIQEYVDILEQWRNDLFGTGDTVEQQIRDVGEEVIASIPDTVTQYVAENADTLKGDSGATYTPAVDTNGNLSWTNDKGLTNPATVNIKGPKGDQGAGFKVLGYFDTVDALEAGVTSPSDGDAYGVGTEAPYDIYIYSASNGWVNNGALQGAQGESGATFIPSVDSDGNLSWTNDKDLTNPETVNIKGDTPVRGTDYWTEEDIAVIKEYVDSKVPIVTATSDDGVAYVATVSNMDSLEVGKEIVIIPSITSTSVSATLNVNSLGAKTLRCPLTTNTSATTAPTTESWLVANKPVKVRWNGTFWVTDLARIDATTITGSVSIEHGGTGATTVVDARTNLEVYSTAETDAAISAVKPAILTVTLSASGWDSTDLTQTVTATGVLEEETAQLIQPTPAISSQTAYYDAGIKCTAQAADSLTFTADTIPTEDLTVYVVITEVTT